MLKLTSLALGLLTVIAIAPASQAATNPNPLSLHTPAGDLHSQVILKIGGHPDYREGVEAYRRREIELEREREAHRRREIELEREREAARRHHKSSNRYRSADNRDNYRGEYRRDR